MLAIKEVQWNLSNSNTLGPEGVRVKCLSYRTLDVISLICTLYTHYITFILYINYLIGIFCTKKVTCLLFQVSASSKGCSRMKSTLQCDGCGFGRCLSYWIVQVRKVRVREVPL